MQGLQNLIKRSGLLTVALSFVAFLVVVNLGASPKATAATLSNRSLTVSSSSLGSVTTGSPGSGSNGQKTAETFSFKIGTTGNVGSILIEYCTTPLAGTTCTAPTGFTAANIVTPVTTGFSSNNFSNDTSTVLTGAPWNCSGSSPGRTNCVALKRTSAASETANTTVTVSLGGGASDFITNPTTTGTFFARITTYSDTAYATAVDNGATASSTVAQVTITAKVQEALNFSVGTTVTDPSTTCAAFSDSGALSIGDTNNGLSSTTAFDGHSYFRISTNALNGTKIYYSGDTLKSGTNSIVATGTTQPTPTTAVSSSPGTSQFGLALDSSDTQGGFGYSFTSLSGTAPYTAGNGTITSGGSALFAFAPSSVTTPVQIASTSNVITCDTGSVRYLANIATNTPPGIYTTAINYIAVPTY